MDYRLIRSKRKTLALEVTKSGEIIVRAPMRCPERTISDFIRKHEKWLSEKLAAVETRRQNHPEPDEERIEKLREAAKSLLPERVAYFAEIMNVKPAGVKITSAKTRFGSCSGKNSICFSYRLMDYPPDAVDYVVVHELAHIVHKNHGADFYKLIESVMPDYKRREKLLRG